jgi:hypothetical protein
MVQLAEAYRPCSPRYLPSRQRFMARPRRTADLRSLAEEMLREMAFVYQATRSIRQSMASNPAGNQ